MPLLIDVSTAKPDRVQMIYDLLYTLVAFVDQELGEDAIHPAIRCVLDSLEEEIADELRARGIDPNANPVEWRWVKPGEAEESVIDDPRTLDTFEDEDDTDTQPTSPVPMPVIFANVFADRDLEGELDTPWGDSDDDDDGDLAEPAS